MAQPTPDIETIRASYQEFSDSFETLLMATSNNSGQPEASYATYIKDSGEYYVYLSELAPHTGNLLEHPQCSVLFIENEEDASHLFARQRLTYQCEASEVTRGSDHFENIMDKFEKKFSNFMKTLRQLEDFHLFRIKPNKGSYVAGFAKAYEISGPNLETITLRNEKGHTSQNKSVESKINNVAAA
ncbi:MAG: pyridoxamine 5'-phosphate oxidase [Gammaproteobacteria bacterium]|nr:MAG: pyridoxamine 5'-phosphate oxidase [Gammaproteobacteria bacterium]